MVGRVAAVGTLVAVIAGGATAADQARFAPRLRAELVRSLASGPSLILDVSQTTAQPAPAGVTFVVPDAQPFRLPPVGTVVGDAALALVPAPGGAPSLLAGRLVARAEPGPGQGLRPQSGRRDGSRALRLARGGPKAHAAVLRLRAPRDADHGLPAAPERACGPRGGTASRGTARSRSRIPARRHIRLARALHAGREGRRGGRLPDDHREPRHRRQSELPDAPGPWPRRGAAGRYASGAALVRQGPGRARIRISAAGDVLARARTSRSGSYAVRVRAPKRVGTLALQARLPSRLVRCGGRTVDAPAAARARRSPE